MVEPPTLGTQEQRKRIRLHKEVQEHLSASKTKAHQIAQQIADEDEDYRAVIRFGRCLRISADAFMRWIRRQRCAKD